MIRYIEGYKDCIKDIESILPQKTGLSTMELLNLYIVALYLAKLNLYDLQNEEKESVADKFFKLLIIKGRQKQ